MIRVDIGRGRFTLVNRSSILPNKTFRQYDQFENRYLVLPPAIYSDKICVRRSR
jgi:hypothetical protein